MFTITKESKRSQKMLTVLTVNQRVVGSSPTGGASRGEIHGFFHFIPYSFRFQFSNFTSIFKYL